MINSGTGIPSHPGRYRSLRGALEREGLSGADLLRSLPSPSFGVMLTAAGRAGFALCDRNVIAAWCAQSFSEVTAGKELLELTGCKELQFAFNITGSAAATSAGA